MIFLSLYLKRTGRTLESFIDSNALKDVSAFEKRCADLGVSVTPSDVSAVKAILKAKKQLLKSAESSLSVQPKKKRKIDDLEQ